MNPKATLSANSFAEYLQRVIKLDTLQQLTHGLDEQLADSQRAMREISLLFNSLPRSQNNTVNSNLQHEDLTTFLNGNDNKNLKPDVVTNTVDVDLDDTIASMKAYAEELKKNIVLTQAQPRDTSIPRETLESLGLDSYTTTLCQLAKRLANIKINKNLGEKDRTDLEEKLTQLCRDVEMFTQLVQAKKSLSKSDKTQSASSQHDKALSYDVVITKLLAGINEVTYLLQNNKNN